MACLLKKREHMEMNLYYKPQSEQKFIIFKNSRNDQYYIVSEDEWNREYWMYGTLISETSSLEEAQELCFRLQLKINDG